MITLSLATFFFDAVQNIAQNIQTAAWTSYSVTFLESVVNAAIVAAIYLYYTIIIITLPPEGIWGISNCSLCKKMRSAMTYEFTV